MTKEGEMMKEILERGNRVTNWKMRSERMAQAPLVWRATGVGQGEGYRRGGVQGRQCAVGDYGQELVSFRLCHTDCVVKSGLEGKPFLRLLYVFVPSVFQPLLTEFHYIPGLC